MHLQQRGFLLGTEGFDGGGTGCALGTAPISAYGHCVINEHRQQDFSRYLTLAVDDWIGKNSIEKLSSIC